MAGVEADPHLKSGVAEAVNAPDKFDGSVAGQGRMIIVGDRGTKDRCQSVSKLLADTVTVHHGHMPEITLTSATTATSVWAMFDWVDWSQSATPERTFQGYGHYHEEYEKGADGRWRIKRLHLTRLRVDHPTPKS